MSRRHSCLAALTLALAALPASAAPACDSRPLMQAIKDTSGGDFVPPSAPEVARAAMLFEEHFREPQGMADAQEQWMALGFELRELCPANGRWWLVRERERQGRGAFLFAAEPAGTLVLQAPHRRDDWGTGRLAAKLAAMPQTRAVAWNTVPRRIGDEPTPGAADLAHLERSFLQAFTLGQARGLPGSRLVQLHGYATDSRRSAAARTGNVIVSSGRFRVSAPARSIYNCLYRDFSGTLLFPVTTRELGGTRNAQGQLFRARGQDGFVHVELSRPLRAALLQDTRQQQTLLRCFVSAQ